MSLKDYYRTLGIASDATLQDVKKAYRLLAHKYHPDKNPEDTLSVAYFREIQEAYTVLSNEKKRKVYDEARYFAGLSSRKKPQHISGHWILVETQKLSRHMQKVDSYRMNHKALQEYVMLILSESHLAVLALEKNDELNKQIIQEILLSVENIHFSFFIAIAERLRLLAINNEQLQAMITSYTRKKQRNESADKYLPLLVIVITIVLCILMLWYGRQVF